MTRDETSGEDLRATSDAVERSAERIAELERRKKQLRPDDPAVDQISREVELLVRRMATDASIELSIAGDLGEKGNGRPN